MNNTLVDELPGGGEFVRVRADDAVAIACAEQRAAGGRDVSSRTSEVGRAMFTACAMTWSPCRDVRPAAAPAARPRRAGASTPERLTGSRFGPPANIAHPRQSIALRPGPFQSGRHARLGRDVSRSGPVTTGPVQRLAPVGRGPGRCAAIVDIDATGSTLLHGGCPIARCESFASSTSARVAALSIGRTHRISPCFTNRVTNSAIVGCRVRRQNITGMPSKLQVVAEINPNVIVFVRIERRHQSGRERSVRRNVRTKLFRFLRPISHASA